MDHNNVKSSPDKTPGKVKNRYQTLAKPASDAKDVDAKDAKKLPPELINLAVKIQELPSRRRYLAEKLIAHLQQDV